MDPTPEKVDVVNGEVRVPVSSVSDDKLHKFVCGMKHAQGEFCPMHGDDGKADVRILAIQRSDGSAVVAYDACALCGTTGYVQEGDELICKRCGAPINRDTVGEGGGCNPVALPYKIEGSDVVMKGEDISKMAGTFR